MGPRSIYYYLILLAFLSEAAHGSRPFKVAQLPSGKSLTLARPALMQVGQDMKITLNSQDLPQTVKFSLATSGVGKMGVTIYDDEGKLTKEFVLKKRDTTLYTFQKLTNIKVVTMGATKKARGLKLLLESNKPLGISR